MNNKFGVLGILAFLCGCGGVLFMFVAAIPKEYTHYGAVEYNMQHMSIIEEKLDSLKMKMDSLCVKVSVVDIKGKNDE